MSVLVTISLIIWGLFCWFFFSSSLVLFPWGLMTTISVVIGIFFFFCMYVYIVVIYLFIYWFTFPMNF